MKLFVITTFALAVLLTACSDTQESGATGDDLFTSQTEFYSFQPLVPLPVSTKPGDTLYVNATWGLEIVEILADGIAVAGERSYALFDDPGIGPVTVQSGTYIYNIHRGQMFFGKLSKPFDYTLFEYSLPEDVAELVIRYRLVPHDSNPEPRVYTMTARRAG